MKNLIIILCMWLPVFSVVAQTETDHKGLKVIGGVIFVASGTTDFSDIEKPFTFGQNLLPNICLITSKTYHNFVYGINGNFVKVVNGYPFGKRNLDVYVTPGLQLNTGVANLSIGLEKKIRADNVNFFLFSEVGKTFEKKSKFTMCLGFHMNIQTLIHQKK